MITTKAYAKINWAIDVIERTRDGYHEIDTLMQTIDVFDELTFENSDKTTLRIEGAELSGGEDNLIMKAARALQKIAGDRRGAKITLIKRIPMGAGLGGGSADCAISLIALNELWELGLGEEELSAIAASLGKDVPFCLGKGLARARGLGERLEWIKTDKSFPLLIVKPEAGLSTGKVYSRWDETKDSIPQTHIDQALRAILTGDLSAMSASCKNALEPPAKGFLPEIEAIENELLSSGALMSLMTGSGSAVFGVFNSMEKAKLAASEFGGKAIATKTVCR